MEVVLRRPAIAQLDAADLDDAMAEIDFKSGRFGIENDLPAHVASSTTDAVAISTPSLASRSASSLPGSPLCPLTQRQSILCRCAAEIGRASWRGRGGQDG